MTYKKLKQQIKEEQKNLALTIRRGKHLRKPENRVDVTDQDKKLFFSGPYFSDWRVRMLGDRYRHIHIAYCHFFNRTPFSMIEETNREGNKPTKLFIDTYINDWKNLIGATETECKIEEEETHAEAA